MTHRNMLFFLLSLGLTVTSSIAQVSTGTILGTITDKSGGIVAGAEVTVTDVGTNFPRKVVTGSDGGYLVQNLKPGKYQVSTSVSGFKTQVVGGIVLQVDQRARVDIVLEVGEVTEQVTIESTVPVIATDNATVGEVIDNKKVLELPLNGRQFLQLALLTPGTQRNNRFTGGYDESGGSFSSNGMDPGGNTTMLDGVINMEFGAGRQNFSPSIDMIQEFKIQTNVYDASFGLSGAAQINVVTKRGSREYHGSAYEFHRNDNLDARNFFQVGKIPEFRRHQFGGTFGGKIPGSEKDFFFFAYEGNRQARGLTATMNLPSPAVRSGDFSGAGTTIYDPLTLNPATGQRQPFPGNIIPDNRITPQARYIRQFWPNPTLPGIQRNFVANPTQIADGDQYSIRYDRNFSEKDTINFRFTRVLNTSLNPVWRAFIPPLPGFGQNLDLRGHSLNSSWTHIFGPTAVNSFNFGYSRYWRNADNESTVAGFFLNGGSRGQVSGPEFFKNADIQGLAPDRQKAGFPRISVSGWSDPVSDDTFAPVSELYNNYVFTDTFSKVMGKHSWKVGFDVIRNTIPVEFEANTRGSINFTPRYTTAAVNAAGNQFNSLADFLLGQVTSSAFNGNRLSEDLVQSWYMGYVHDDWKVHPNLTLNLGLRYEIWDRMIEKQNRLVAFDLDTRQFVFAGNRIPTLPGTPSPAVTGDSLGYERNMATQTEFNDFAPRLGFAWRMLGSTKTVLRGGYGVFYSWVTQNTTQAMAFGPPWVPNISITSEPSVPAVTFQIPYSSTVVPSNSGRVATAKTNRTPYVQQYSMSLAHEITPKLGAEISYVGNAGRKNFINFDYNQAFPGPGSVVSRRPFPAFGGLGGSPTWGTNHYDALQVKVRKEYGPEGLLLLGSYTWAKALGNWIAGPNFNGSQPFRDTRNWKDDSGPTNFDLRQIVSVSWVYELPLGKGKPFGTGLSGLANHIIGGWKTGGIASFNSGRHLTAFDIFNNSNSGSSRPNVIGKPNKQNHSSTGAKINRFFDTSAFVRAPQFTFGNSGTGNIEGPGLQIWDISLYKDFRIQEGKRLQFRVEFFNAFNHANFNDPGTTFGSPDFGVISSAGDARSIQFGLRFDF